MERIRGGRGLGDAIYLRPIAEHYVRAGKRVAVLSNYREVFLGSGAEVEPFSRTSGANIIAHYVDGKPRPDTTQWQDLCRSARVQVPLRFDWTIRNAGLIQELKAKATGKPIVVVHGGRVPMDRDDGFGMELLPDRAAFEAVLCELASTCFLVQVGKARQIYPLPVDVDLNGSTSVSDVLDIAAAADGIVAQCSFAIPLAEALDKPLLAIWSGRAAKSQTDFIRQTTPRKVLSGPKDSYVVDTWPKAQLKEVTREFRGV